jgi:hypothetical protein
MESMWQKIADSLNIREEDKMVGNELFSEYSLKGYIEKSCIEMLKISDGAIAWFYKNANEKNGVMSPVKDKKDSSWMAESDFCFVNIRATGVEQEFGNMVSVCKLFPLIRADAIHLGPFTAYDFEVIYAVTSVYTISYKIVNRDFEKAGIDAELQMKALVQAAHSLGKTVGFDIEPHTAQFAMSVIMNPEMFRWYKMNSDKSGLDWGMDSSLMMKEESQKKIVMELKSIRERVLKENGLKTIEEEHGDTIEKLRQKESIYFNLIKILINGGYWTVTSQAWNCHGIPAYESYNREGNYIQFYYEGENGKNEREKAYPILTPIKFYKDIPVNKFPEIKPELFEKGVEFFCDIFSRWRDEFDFDFVRYDSVDHIFDSIKNRDYNWPSSDRPTPEILKRCIEASKENGKNYIGNLAERMGIEIEEYASIGYDLMLGTDMMEYIDRKMMEKSFEIGDRLKKVNQNRGVNFSIPFCIDTHDTGNIGLMGKPLIKLMGHDRMRQRHFISRFISCGSGRRPKYEVMGFTDMSYGLHKSNVKDINLNWQSDMEFNKKYNILENVYEKVKKIIETGEITSKYIDDKLCWWIIKSENELLIPIVSLENHNSCGVYNFEIKIENKLYKIREYLFENGSEAEFELENGKLHIGELKYLEFKIFKAEEIK